MAVALLSVIGQLQDLRQLTLGMVNVQEGGGTIGQAYQMLTEACKLLGLCFVEGGHFFGYEQYFFSLVEGVGDDGGDGL